MSQKKIGASEDKTELKRGKLLPLEWPFLVLAHAKHQELLKSGVDKIFHENQLPPRSKVLD